jgi:uncharacterized protein YjiS (DUF1127 family)
MHTILSPRSSWHFPSGSAWGAAGRTVVRSVTVVTETTLGWLHRSRTRRHLAALDDRMLRDIGLDRSTIWNETQKPFWRD